MGGRSRACASQVGFDANARQLEAWLISRTQRVQQRRLHSPGAVEQWQQDIGTLKEVLHCPASHLLSRLLEISLLSSISHWRMLMSSVYFSFRILEVI